MRRAFLPVVILILSSLACGIVTPTALSPTSTVKPSIPPSVLAGVSTSTATLEVTVVSPGGATAAPTEAKPTRTPFPTSVLDAQMSQQINQIQSQVIQERELQPKHPVPFVLLTTDQLRQTVVTDYRADNTDQDIADSMLELSVIGLIDPKFDWIDFYINLLSEQVAGFYDNDVGEMFVVQGQSFGGFEHFTYAHEYTHVLQDQNYDIKNGLKLNDQTLKTDSERYAAGQALLEGDATLSQLLWFKDYASAQDQQQVMDFYNNLSSPVYDSAPAFLKQDFVFPYTQGLTFVQAIYDQGGWSSIDAVYHNPPVSTEQILHPSLYPSDTPVAVNLPDIASHLGSGWREVSDGVVGEWYTYLILAQGENPAARLSETTAQPAAAGWGGDHYKVLHDDASNLTAFVVKYAWDTSSDASEFASAFESYADSRFGVSGTQQGDTLTWDYSTGYSTFYHSGDTTVWIIAPDSATAQLISGLVMP